MHNVVRMYFALSSKHTSLLLPIGTETAAKQPLSSPDGAGVHSCGFYGLVGDMSIQAGSRVTKGSKAFSLGVEGARPGAQGVGDSASGALGVGLGERGEDARSTRVAVRFMPVEDGGEEAPPAAEPGSSQTFHGSRPFCVRCAISRIRLKADLT